MRKIGARTYSSWMQGIVLMVLYVCFLGVVLIGGMNDIYSGNNSISGLGTEDLTDSFESFQNSATQRIRDGDISVTDLGAILFLDSWTIIIGAFEFIFGFLFGGWINTIIITYLKLPETVAFMLQGLWIISIVFIILTIVFKRRT